MSIRRAWMGAVAAVAAALALGGCGGSGGDGGGTNPPNPDTTPPSATAAVTDFTDDALGTIAADGFASDTAPKANGSLSGTLAADESVQVFLNGTLAGPAVVSGTSWSFTPATALAAGTWAWQARTIDAAGNATALSAAAALTIVTAMPAATIAQIVDDSGTVIAPGGTTADNTPTLRGTLSTALPAGYTLRVFRDGTAVGTASPADTAWNFTDPGASGGFHSYAARTEAGAVLGALSGAYAITVSTVAPGQIAAVTLIADDYNGALADGATTADTTPAVSGTLAVALGSGESVRLLRNGSQAALFGASGTTWTYTEPTALGAGTYTYQAQVVNGSGLTGPLGSVRSVTVDPSSIPLHNAATTLATIDGFAPSGGAIRVNNRTTPLLAGTIERSLKVGEVVKVYLDGAPAGDASVIGTTWKYTSAALPDGIHAFRARIELAADPLVYGAWSATVNDPIDTVPPTQVASVTAIYDDRSGLVSVGGGVSADNTPRIEGIVSAALGPGEGIQLSRNGAVLATLSVSGTSWSGVEAFPLPDGVYEYSARVVDAAGNLGPTTGTTMGVTIATP